MFVCRLVVATAVLLLCPTAWAQYKAEYFSRPGFARTWFSDINNAGVIVGYSGNLEGINTQGFIFAAGVYESLPPPFGVDTFVASGVSDDGVIVGHTIGEKTADRVGFIFENGKYTPFQIRGAEGTDVRGISPDGRWISGLYYKFGDPLSRSYVYDRLTGELDLILEPREITNLVQSVNNAGMVVGSGTFQQDGFPPVFRTSFIYDAPSNSRLSFTIGELDTRARGINEYGLIAGFLVGAPPAATTLFYGMIGSFSLFDLASSGATTAALQGINNAGQLVGVVTFADGTFQGFVATPCNGCK